MRLLALAPATHVSLATRRHAARTGGSMLSVGLAQPLKELIAAGELVQGYMCAAVGCSTVHVCLVPHWKTHFSPLVSA